MIEDNNAKDDDCFIDFDILDKLYPGIKQTHEELEQVAEILQKEERDDLWERVSARILNNMENEKTNHGKNGVLIFRFAQNND